ncbi:MAG TPA: hypothetical protein VI669_17710 [Vicinamibacteria bacterium]
MALDEGVIEKRRKSLPKLWALVEAFRGKYKGVLHSNWGAPFSVRTRVKEGKLEIDFAEKETLLRLEGLRLPDGVSFTTNRKFFAGPYPKKIGQAGVALGWDVQGGEKADEAAVRGFLETPANAEDLKRLPLKKGGWISIDSESVFLTMPSGDFARLDSAVQILCGLARRHAGGQPPLPARPRGPRLTGRQPSSAQLKKWPNWRHCLDEEDEGGQDETTIRPDGEQSVIGPETTCTAFLLSTADGRRFPGFARAADAEDLAKGRIDLLAALDPRGAWQVVMAPGSWTLAAGQRAAPKADDARWPIEGTSVLPLSSGKRLSFVLKASGKAVGPPSRRR